MKYLLLLLFTFSHITSAQTTWLDKVQDPNKQQQLDLRWQATGGEADLRFIYNIFSIYGTKVNPAPEFPNKHWSANHLVFPIDKSSHLNLQIPYGIIEKVTNGSLKIAANLSFSHLNKNVVIESLILEPVKVFNSSDLVNFIVKDNNGNELFTASSIHIELDLDKKLLKMSNIDLVATQKFAQLLNQPQLANQVVAQVHTYSKLIIPELAITSPKNIQALTCVSNPIWPPAGDVDVTLLDINFIAYLGDVGPDKIVITPAASLKNIGTADVAWYQKFSGNSPPYNTDQHPYLNWSIYREVDNRFEQIGLSGIKHAFYTINSNCACPGGHVLGLGCEDVYGTGNNDSDNALGPREELDAFSGVWKNCGSYFDPMPCTGSQQNTSNQPGQNRLLARKDQLTDANNTSIYFQAWYVIRDDINIFNSMGYRTIAPTPNGSGWDINTGPTFSNGAALDNYVPPNTSSAMQASKTVNTSEGHLTVAIKVTDLGNGNYRYNYAIENYDYDPRFSQFRIPMPNSTAFSNPVFSDSDDNSLNDWAFSLNNNEFKVTGDSSNEQDWGMLFSFSFTVAAPPIEGSLSIDVVNSASINELNINTLVPNINDFDTLFKSSFEN